MERALSRRMAVLGGTLTAAGIAQSRTSVSAVATGESNGGVRIMPLGDSITEGHTAYPGGYRVELWQRLAADGYTVDFVGSLANGPAELGDHNHEGHSGWRIDHLDASINSWLQQSKPRTILLLIGTNDVNLNHDAANAPARLSALTDHILAAQPQCELFVATIPPHSDPTVESRVRAYNAAIPEVVARKDAHVHLVNIYDALTTADLADGIHPSRDGHEKMAAVWYDALRSVPAALEPILAKGAAPQ